MFSLDLLQQDAELNTSLSYLLTSDFKKIGCFKEVRSINQLLLNICQASYEKVRHLPYRNISVYRTYDLGLGYIDYLSLYRFREMIDLGLINKDIFIHLTYKYGNILSMINSSDINTEVLLTDEMYVFVKEDTQSIWSLKIGKPTNPNRLYYQSQYDNISSTIDKISTIEHLNAIIIKEDRDIDFI